MSSKPLIKKFSYWLNRLRMVEIIIIVLGVVVALIAYQQTTQYQTILDSTRIYDTNMKQMLFSAGMAYAQFGELLDGDTSLDIEDIYQQLDNAQKICKDISEVNLSLTGGNTPVGGPPEGTPGSAQAMCTQLDKLSKVFQEYWDASLASNSPSTVSMTELDTTYTDFLKASQPFHEAATPNFRSAANRMWQTNAEVSIGLGMVFLFIAGMVGYNRNRLQKHSRQLEVENEQRRLLEAELTAERDLVNALINHVPDAIFAKDMQRKFVVVNPAGARVMGAENTEVLLGKSELDFLPADVATRILADDQAVFETGQPVLNREECFSSAETGRLDWRLTTRVPLRDQSGNVSGLVGISRSITQQKEAEQTLRDMNQKLKHGIDSLAQRSAEAALINEVMELLLACSTLDEAHMIFAEKMEQLFPCESGILYILSNSRDMMEQVAAWGKILPDPDVFAPEDCWGLRRGRMHINHFDQAKDSQTCSRSVLMCHHIQEETPADTLCLPLVAQGETIGLLHMRHFFSPDEAQECNEDWFTHERQQLVLSVSDALSLTLANLKLRLTLRQQSIRDPLTGLFNRRYLEETFDRELQRAARNSESVGVMMLDIDHFKQFNDTFGHPAADIVLVELGQRLKKSFRGGDIACRYGGEEFIILLPQASLENTCQRANELLDSVRSMKVSYEGQLLGQITVSIGVAGYPAHGHTVEELIRRADQALYQAKLNGRNQMTFVGKNIQHL